MVRLLFIVCTCVVLWSGVAIAGVSVKPRVGEHEGYSRIVFDWPSRQNYSAKKDGEGTLVLDFGTEAKLSKTLSTPIASYINALEVISTNPLKVSLSFPTGAKIRHFAAGRRVIVDVYGAPGAKPNKAANKTAAAKKSNSKQAPKAVPKGATKKQPEQKPPVAQKAAQKKSSKTPASVPVEVVEQEELKEPPPIRLPENQAKPATITFSSSKAQGLAVFTLNDELWLANDLGDALLEPQLAGAGAGAMKSLSPVKALNGKVYRTKAPEGLNVRGQGGGLVWRIVLSPEPHTPEPTKARRARINLDEPRSGKIIWPFKTARGIVSVRDPMTGLEVKAVTVKDAKEYSGPGLDFVDFKVLPSVAGLAIMPKVDDLRIKITDLGVEVSRPSGLAILPENRVAEYEDPEKRARQAAAAGQAALTPEKKIFDFGNWDMGGIQKLTPNTNVVLGTLHEVSDPEKVEALVNLAKVYLANAQGAEALGFLHFAEDIQPELEKNPEFTALKGIAQAIDLRSEDAFANLSKDRLKPFEEIGYWRSFVLADLGDWMQAKEVLPTRFETLYSYSPLVMNKLGLVLAEVELRSGTVDSAERILSEVESNIDTLFPPQVAALNYLKGEAARQKGDVEKTKKLWKELVDGTDDLYRAKAGLAYSRLLVNEKKITPAQAIDGLERLRYAWRGDELESQIYYWLGKTYFEAGDYVRGLNILREAASVSAGTDLGTRIAAEMIDEFTNLFLGPRLKQVSPPDAAALYEQFSELVPVGPKGDEVVERLAEHMVQADLLERASGLLAHQLEHRLEGIEAYRVGARLAAIYLIDGKATEAQKSIKKTMAAFDALPEEMQTQDKKLEMALLSARALSKLNRPDQALKLLEDLDRLPSVNRLMADIAWSAGYWDDAAEALEDVILDENISLTRPLSDQDAGLFLNRAVALNLASDRVGLANIREKYSDVMAQTDKARLFEVVTRPRQSAALADRQTLASIVSEVDLFGAFLESYKTAAPPTQ